MFNQDSHFLLLFETVKFDCSNRHFYISDGIVKCKSVALVTDQLD